MSEEQRCGACKWHKPSGLHAASDCTYPEARLPDSVVRKLHAADYYTGLWTYPHLGTDCPTFDRTDKTTPASEF